MKITALVTCLFTILMSASVVGGATIEWGRQLGTSSDDASYGVSADGLGNVYISGYTSGSLGGTNAGSYDAFLIKIVPEPSSLLLICFGLLALVPWRRSVH